MFRKYVLHWYLRLNFGFLPFCYNIFMKIIDLSQKLYHNMPVYPGDPPVIIEQVQTFSKDGWNMKRMTVNLHDGTHVNIPIHGTKDGRTLDSYFVDHFIGESIVFKNKEDIVSRYGIIFNTKNIDWDLAKIIADRKPRFVGLSEDFDFDEEIEKFLLGKGIISYERLANTKKLPKKFMFYGVPLNIKEADGSPVRAFAVID